jgi:hypothetical protein
VTGFTLARLGAASGAVDWAKVTRLSADDAQGAAHAASTLGAPAAPGMLTHNQLLLPWAAAPAGDKAAGKASLSVTHEGAGRPWLTVQSLAAVDLQAPLAAGYQIRKTVTPV